MAATYSALLQLPVVAGLLDAVKELLDQRGVLGLGPSGGFVLSRHFAVGRSVEKDDVVFRLWTCRQGSLRLLALGLRGCERWECDREVHQKQGRVSGVAEKTIHAFGSKL
jgi:hypothetical protein